MTVANSPQKVLVIGGYAPSLINFRGPLLLSMRRHGHIVVAAAGDFDNQAATKAALERIGVEAVDLPLQRTGLNPLADARLLFELVGLLRRVRPDVVLAYTIKPVIFGLLAASIARVPRSYALITGVGYVFTERARGKRRLIRKAAVLLYRSALRRATTVLFQNPDDARLFHGQRMLDRRVPTMVVNGSGVDLDHFQATQLPQTPIRFLLIARLLTVKGIREYAEAATAILRQRRDTEFHLVGGFDSNPDGLSPAVVEKWADERTLIWHGEVADVRPFIAACHVYVLPSYREGTPRSVLEAMAMARPIITTDVPGCRQTVVDGYNGFLVPARDPGALKAAMERFLDEPSLISAMAERSRKIAEVKYDVHAVNDVMLNVMDLK